MNRMFPHRKVAVTTGNAVAALQGVDEATRHIVSKSLPFTMTSPERLCAIVDSVRYLEDAKIPGAIVECGVWKGGSAMAAALALLNGQSSRAERDLYLYDTYEGMTDPTEVDRDLEGNSAADKFRAATSNGRSWCRAPIDEVQYNLLSTGYPSRNLHFIRGKVEDTIPGTMPEEIAMLRLDTDWYESTRHELIHLFPRVMRGGVVIIDDYGHWQGAQKATNEFLKANNLHVFLCRVDYTARLFIKP